MVHASVRVLVALSQFYLERTVDWAIEADTRVNRRGL